MKPLPDFNDNPSNRKNAQLRQPDIDCWKCHSILLRLLEQTAARLKKPPSELRILDFGCGRGMKVANLRQHGYECYGVEINPLYVSNANAYFEEKHARSDLISLLDKNGRSRFADRFFDILFTDQVLEHVEDLGSMLREMNRVMTPSALSLHIFPSARSLVEAHMRLPVVHWLPKGGPQRAAIRVLLSLGLGAPYFKEFSNQDRATIFARFSETDTFYRSSNELARIFGEYGFALRNVAREKFLCRGGIAARVAAIPIVGDLAALTYGELFQSYFLASKHEAISHFEV